MARGATRAARGREGADAAQRRAGAAAAGAALGPDRQGVPTSTPTRASASLADLFRGRSQLLVYHFMFGPDYTAGLPVLLGDRGRLQRVRRPPGQPRRDALGGLAGAAGEAAGVQAADGLDASPGRPRWAATSTPTSTSAFTEEQQREGASSTTSGARPAWRREAGSRTASPRWRPGPEPTRPPTRARGRA